MCKLKTPKSARLFTSIFTISIIFSQLNAQQSDTLKDERFSLHFQTTVINQFKPSFSAKYSGDNSLMPQQDDETSLTSTLYAGLKLWKGASIFLNPEIAGGSGLSSALGVASAPNGETFRVGDPAPHLYVARLFFKQIFALSKQTIYQENDINQIAEKIPTRYISLTIGKVGVADFFDDNKFSHDPRTQFLSWGLMDNGAWDYPANTRGYTPSIVIEYITPKNELRYGASLVPVAANANNLNWDINKASSHSIEYTHRYKIKNRSGAIRALGFFTTTDMGNYRQSISLSPQNPVITDTRKYGNTKYGFGLNAEQDITSDLGCFFRASWNDGNNETWAFTEIDHSVSAGFSLTGRKWNRQNDNIGLASVASGISKAHAAYLKAGGKGFMLGDGNLNYAWEHLLEVYYSAELVKKHIYLTGAYQFLIDPGYNKDRQGPVHIFSVRLHAIV